MSRASSDAMDRLHASVATVLIEELGRAKRAAEQPRKIQVEIEGKPVEQSNPEYSALNPQLIDKVLKFLKDNGIDSPAKNEAVSRLALALEELDLDQMGAA